MNRLIIQEMEVWHWDNPAHPPRNGRSVTLFDLELDGFQGRFDAQLLSDRERRRAAQYKKPPVRDRFIIRRSLLRLLLADYIDTPPHEIAIEETPQGKPFLNREYASGRLEFSVSSSDARALYAFTWNRRVGVDVENNNNPVDYLSIARQFFTPIESAWIERLPIGEQKIAFLKCWTQKEAYIKAAGVRSLNSFETDISSCAIRDLSDPDQNQRWLCSELPTGKDWTSSLVVEQADSDQSCNVAFQRIIP